MKIEKRVPTPHVVGRSTVVIDIVTFSAYKGVAPSTLVAKICMITCQRFAAMGHHYLWEALNTVVTRAVSIAVG